MLLLLCYIGTNTSEKNNKNNFTLQDTLSEEENVDIAPSDTSKSNYQHSISQSHIKGVSNIFMPTIIISDDKKSIDLNNLEDSMLFTKNVNNDNNKLYDSLFNSSFSNNYSYN